MSAKEVQPANLWRQFPWRYQETRPATLVTWSTIYAAPRGYEEMVPYTVAIIQFADGSQACVQLTDIDPDKLEYGMKLKAVFRKMHSVDEQSVIPYGTKYTSA